MQFFPAFKHAVHIGINAHFDVVIFEQKAHWASAFYFICPQEIHAYVRVKNELIFSHWLFIGIMVHVMGIYEAIGAKTEDIFVERRNRARFWPNRQLDTETCVQSTLGSRQWRLALIINWRLFVQIVNDTYRPK